MDNDALKKWLTLEQLKGSWNLLSWRDVAVDGTVTYPYTETAQGRIIFDVAGRRMAGFLMHPQWQQHASEARFFLAYSARVELAGDTLLHHVDFASNPRMIGVTLRRRATLLDDVLTLETLPTVGKEPKSGRHILAWQRGVAY
jgi:hypothetical protein